MDMLSSALQLNQSPEGEQSSSSGSPLAASGTRNGGGYGPFHCHFALGDVEKLSMITISSFFSYFYGTFAGPHS
jgi:hypothetical protein